jgi:uncharacterized integral membrane protein
MQGKKSPREEDSHPSEPASTLDLPPVTRAAKIWIAIIVGILVAGFIVVFRVM